MQVIMIAPTRSIPLLVSLALASACAQDVPPPEVSKPSLQLAPIDVSVVLSGGNVIVYNKVGKEATVGAVAASKGKDQSDHNDHWMDLVVAVGNVEAGGAHESGFTIDKATNSPDKKYWRLYRDDIEICPNGVCPTVGSLVVDAPANETCDDPNAGLSIPNMSRLHQGKPVVEDWPDLLESRLLLRSGTIERVEGNLYCTELRRGATEKIKMKMADGHRSIRNKQSVAAEYVDVKFVRGDRMGQMIRVTPVGNSIELTVSATEHPSEPEPKKDQNLVRFSPFYKLLKGVSSQETYSLHFDKPLGVLGFNPGSECPMGYFEF